MNSDIVHYLNLRGVGGVQSQFFRLLNHPNSSDYDHLVVHYDKLSQSRVEEIKSVADYLHYKRMGPIKIPGDWLRKKLFDFRASDLYPSVIIYYEVPSKGLRNKLTNFDATQIFYEHGGIWHKKRSNKFLKKMDKVLVNSYATRHMIRVRQGIKNKPVEVLYNCLPFMEDNLAIRQKKTTSEFNVLFVGRLREFKGVQSLVLATKHLPGKFNVRIVGDGPSRARLEELKVERNISGIEFIGEMSDPSPQYDWADLLVVPSVRETFGLIVLEGAVHGLPVVASKIDGLPEVIGSEENGVMIEPTLTPDEIPLVDRQDLPEVVYDPEGEQLTEPKFLDPMDLAAAIKKVEAQVDQGQGMAEKLYDRAKEKFSPDRYVSEFYAKILE